MPFLATFAGGAVRPYTAVRIGGGSLVVNYSIVAGGGGGGSGVPSYYFSMGPGGGGGLLQATSITINRMAYVLIGAGGAGATSATRDVLDGFGKNGSRSVLYNGYGLYVETVGGGGSGQNGGSGGGVFGNGTIYPAGLGTILQGNNGAICTSSGQTYGDWGSGGGGGAGGAGTNATISGGAAGGAGLACSATDNVVRAGGGGGYYANSVGAWIAGTGGTGGGTAGTVNGSPVANAAANTGGGAGNRLDGAPGANGGSGIVIIQYAGTVALARGGTITGVGTGPIRHTFTTSGTFIINS